MKASAHINHFPLVVRYGKRPMPPAANKNTATDADEWLMCCLSSIKEHSDIARKMHNALDNGLITLFDFMEWHLKQAELFSRAFQASRVKFNRACIYEDTDLGMSHWVGPDGAA